MSSGRGLWEGEGQYARERERERGREGDQALVGAGAG